MSLFEREVARARARLLRIDQAAAADTLRAYGHVHRRLNETLAALLGRIEEARGNGAEVRPGWLYAQDRYTALISDLESGTADFAEATGGRITVGQREAVDAAVQDAPRLARAAAGPAPAVARESILDAFRRVPHNAFRHLVGFSGDGQPLGDLLAELTPGNVTGVRDALAYGVAAGKSPRVIAREVQTASGATLNRALAISRTEIVRAHRTATSDSLQESKVVAGWTWFAQPDIRTCPVCWAMHGTEHDITETLDSHPLCRCTMVPRTKTWAELGFPGIPESRPTIPPGPDLFEQLPEADQRAILGPTRYGLYADGLLQLPDLVRRTRSEVWGPGLRQASLAEIGVTPRRLGR